MREQARIALQLQRAILPPADRPLRLRGLEAVMRYRPPEEEHNVGGDWYDAVALPGDQVLLRSATCPATESPPRTRWSPCATDYAAWLSRARVLVSSFHH